MSVPKKLQFVGQAAINTDPIIGAGAAECQNAVRDANDSRIFSCFIAER
jgi:hypothetical protein